MYYTIVCLFYIIHTLYNFAFVNKVGYLDQNQACGLSEQIVSTLNMSQIFEGIPSFFF